MYGPEERPKREKLGHWAVSKRLLGGEAINPELMESHPIPHSIPALRTVKVAEFQGGMQTHARRVDRL